ncbi:MAG TPA: nuclear transport factor 2 family protein [Chitinophagaceae bacterium]|nr:nuclear transport factor 2 family protein [Chitinophagaceae bacterium]
MKGAILLLALTGLLLLPSAKSFCQAGDKAILKTLNGRFLNAIINRDTAALSSVLADDFMLINPGGAKRTKQDNLNNILLLDQQVLSINIDSMDIRLVNDNTGIVTAWTTFVIKTGGKKTTGKNCYQDVYVKRNKVWKAVAAHVTMLSGQ